MLRVERPGGRQNNVYWPNFGLVAREQTILTGVTATRGESASICGANDPTHTGLKIRPLGTKLPTEAVALSNSFEIGKRSNLRFIPTAKADNRKEQADMGGVVSDRIESVNERLTRELAENPPRAEVTTEGRRELIRVAYLRAIGESPALAALLASENRFLLSDLLPRGPAQADQGGGAS
jgi:hypothetical protein